MKLRKILALVIVLCFLLPGCGQGQEGPVFLPTEPEDTEPTVDLGKLTILFTGRLGNVFAPDEARGHLGYGPLAAYRDQLEEENQVFLVDGGCSVGSGPWNDEILEIRDAVGYDVLVPGALERDLDLSDDYISCTLDDPALEPYTVLDVGQMQVGFVGITAQYSDDGQPLYDQVQQAIDAAADAGADFVIAVSNLGTDPEDSPCTAVEVLTHTTGLVAWLECGSGSVVEGTTVTDKDNFEIPVCAVGSDFSYVGQVTLDLNQGTVDVELIQELTGEAASVKQLTDALLDEMAPEPETTKPTTADTE